MTLRVCGHWVHGRLRDEGTRHLTSRNPATGESIWIPAKKVVKFRIAKACKDAILG